MNPGCAHLQSDVPFDSSVLLARLIARRQPVERELPGLLHGGLLLCGQCEIHDVLLR